MAHSEIQVVTKEEKVVRESTLPLPVSASESGGEKLADVRAKAGYADVPGGLHRDRVAQPQGTLPTVPLKCLFF